MHLARLSFKNIEIILFFANFVFVQDDEAVAKVFKLKFLKLGNNDFAVVFFVENTKSQNESVVALFGRF